MLDILDLNECNVIDNKFGGKAVGLSLLKSYRYNIPFTLIVEATDTISDFDDTKFKECLKRKLSRIETNGTYNIAIRSSSLNEDSFSYSLAGNYKTIIGNKTFDQLIIGMKEVVKSLNNNSDKMGIVLQKFVKADYSGVIFSSNPVTYSKKEMIINYISGAGEKLVSGKESGTDIIVSINNGNYFFSSKIPNDLIKELCVVVKKLENKLDYPIDIEWAIENNKIIFLQCRPISNITNIKTQFTKVKTDTIQNIPEQLRSHDKIALRLYAQKKGILVSNAYLFIRNNSIVAKTPNIIEMIPCNNDCRGYSSVVIYPTRISNKIVRSFVGKKNDLDNSTMGCCRYGVRTFPRYENAIECLKEFSNLCYEDYWISAVILQELFDPLYTGVIKQNEGEIIIEITRGHFLTKGVVPTSQYILKNSSIISKYEVEQKRWYRILEGHVIECVCNENEKNIVSLNSDELLQIADCFSELLTSNTIIVEFGVLKDNLKTIKPYLIDFVDNNKSKEISALDIEKGILSRGKREGIICHVSVDDYDSLNMHYHDVSKTMKKNNDKIVFFCKRPDIGLLDILNKYDNSNISFVFAEGSILCHLAVILREKNIPAIIIGEFQRFEYLNGVKCLIDADESSLIGKERVIIE